MNAIFIRRRLVAVGMMLAAVAILEAQTGPGAVPIGADPPPVLSTVPTPSTGAMPEPAQMSGLPLQVGDLPPGTVVVRVIERNFSNNVAGLPVKLSVGNTGLVMEATSDRQGRAQFTGLGVGNSVRASAVVGRETLESQQFDLPAQGGVRLVLVAGVSAGSASSAGAPDLLFPIPAGDRRDDPVEASSGPPGGIAASRSRGWSIFAGMVLLSVIGGGAWLSRRGGRRVSVAAVDSGVDPSAGRYNAAMPSAIRPERTQLFETLVQVEKAFRAGQLQPDQYRSRREELLGELGEIDAALDAVRP
jgi:hypothetical protein